MFLQKSFSHSVLSLNYAVFLEKHRPLKNHIRYCKMGKWNSKSAVRYAKTQIDLSPLSTHMDLGSLKPAKVCIFFETLRSRSTPSDSASTTKPLFHRIRRAMDTRRAASCSVPRRPKASQIVVQGWDGTYLPRPSHDDGKFTQGKLPQIISYTVNILYYTYILYLIYYILYIIYYI